MPQIYSVNCLKFVQQIASKILNEMPQICSTTSSEVKILLSLQKKQI